MKMRRLFAVLLLLGALCSAYFLLRGKPPGEEAADGAAACALNVQVVDGRTEAPLAGASVVIAETGGRHTTGSDGRTGAIEMPYAPQAQSGMEEAPWSEATVLVYCEGYYAYALFHVALRQGEVRDGPRVYLFPDDGSMKDTPFVLVEAPPSDWSRALIERFRAE